jgi:L-alanine-DL-glutamate epimerase-like enolase superfamily enzyme
MFSPSVSLISSKYLPVHSNNISAMSEAAAAAAAAAAVFFFLFSTKGPFQGHTVTVHFGLREKDGISVSE